MSLNGQQPEQTPTEPALIVPQNVEAAVLLTRHTRVPLPDGHPNGNFVDIVTLLINAPGRGIALQLLAEDAVKWGEKLAQEGRNAQTGLIL